jgi:hypothetical protein
MLDDIRKAIDGAYPTADCPNLSELKYEFLSPVRGPGARMVCEGHCGSRPRLEKRTSRYYSENSSIELVAMIRYGIGKVPGLAIEKLDVRWKSAAG